MIDIILLIVLVALMCWSSWLDVLWLAAVGCVLYLAGSWLFGDLSHLGFLSEPVTLLVLVVFSLSVGAAWSLWKWRRWMHSTDLQSELRQAKDHHAKSDTDTPFRESVYFPGSAKPSENVERIVTWIVLWPFSMVVYFFQDLLMDAGRWIYDRLGGVYVRITDNALSDDMK